MIFIYTRKSTEEPLVPDILQGINEEAYDVNPDGAVTSADAVLVLKKLAGYDEVLGK